MYGMALVEIRTSILLRMDVASDGVTTNNLGSFGSKLLQVCLVNRHLIK
jgi:hypothetical protein